MDGCKAGDGVCRSRTCQRCPANGAACFGGAAFQVTVPGSTWELSAVGSAYTSMRVETCPPGFVLVRTEDPLLDQCVECPRSTYTVMAGNFRSQTLTVRDAKDAVQECLACPPGATCDGGSRISSQQGYWIPPQPRRAQANVTAVKVYRCPPDACLEGGVCSEGRKGPVCGTCSDGYALSGTQCQKCQQSPRDTRSLLLGIAVGILLLIWYFSLVQPIRKGLQTLEGGSEEEGEPPRCSIANLKRLRKRGLWRAITIIISFWQVVSTFETIYPLNWPSSILDLWHVGAVLRLDLQATPGLSCASAEWKYPVILMIYTIGPPVFAALIYLPTACYVFFSRDARRSGMAKYLHDKVFFICLFLLFLIYPMLSVVSVRGFSCRVIASSSYVTMDYSTLCPIDGASSLWIGVFMSVLLYPCGVPLLFVLLLWRSRVPHMAKRKRQNAILAEMMLTYATDVPLLLKCRLAHYVWMQKVADDALADAARKVYDKHAKTKHGAEELSAILRLDRAQQHELQELLQDLGADTDAEDGFRRFLAIVEEALEQVDAVTGVESFDTVSDAQLEALCSFRWMDCEAAAALGMRGRQGRPSEEFHAGKGASSPEKMKEFLLKTGEKLLKEGLLTLPMLKWDRNSSAEERSALDRFGFLIESYRVEFWYWEIFEMVRKFFTTGLILHIMPDSPEQIAAGFVISVVFMLSFMKTSPFVFSTVSKMQNTSLLAISVTLFYGLMLSVRTSTKTTPEHYDVDTYNSLMVVLLVFLHMSIFLVPLLSFGPAALEMIQRTLTRPREQADSLDFARAVKRLSSLPMIHNKRISSLSARGHRHSSLGSSPSGLKSSKEDAKTHSPLALDPRSDAHFVDTRIVSMKYRQGLDPMQRDRIRSAESVGSSAIFANGGDPIIDLGDLQVNGVQGLHYRAHQNVDEVSTDQDANTAGSSAGSSVQLEARPLLQAPKPPPSPPEPAWLSVSEHRDESFAGIDGEQDRLVLGNSRQGSGQLSKGSSTPSRRSSSSQEKHAARRERQAARGGGKMTSRAQSSETPAVVFSASAEIGFPGSH